MEQYADYRKALASGYVIFLPGVRQRIYHFALNGNFNANTKSFNPEMPTSLLYERTMGPGLRYKLVGVMYTAPYDASEDELDRRAPLSIARWHLHVNFCAPPLGQKPDDRPSALFGIRGSIVTAGDCRAAGGRFIPHISGWMLHVYASETDPAKIWNPSMEMEDVMDPGMIM